MFNTSLISKDKIGVCHQIWGYLIGLNATVMSELAIYMVGICVATELAIYKVGKAIVIFFCITCKLLAAE